jgi:energy-coupling factor transport system permease protein
MQITDASATSAARTSWLHRMDPVPKLACVLAVTVFAFVSFDPVPLFTIALLGLLIAMTAGVARPLVRILLVFAPVIASMIVIQTIAPATCSTTCTVAARLGPITLYQEGMSHALSLVGRILAMEIIALAVLLTTHPSDLFAALARLRVPYALNLMLSLTLQLVPVLQREVSHVLAAQRSRGMEGSGFGAILPAFVPVFVGAFERVQRLSIGLESRGFGSADHRTSYREVRSSPLAVLISIVAISCGAIGTILALTLWSASGTPPLVLPAALTIAIFVGAAAIFAAVIVAAVMAIARV